MPSPAADQRLPAPLPPPPAPAPTPMVHRAVDPIIEWSTGEVAATTALADPETTPIFESSAEASARAAAEEQPAPRAGRSWRRSSAASGRVPVIEPNPGHDEGASNGAVDLREPQRDPIWPEAIPDDLLAPAAPAAPVVLPPVVVAPVIAPAVAAPAVAAPSARQGDTVGLPPAEMLATLIEPEPVVAAPPPPEPEPEPAPIIPTRAERITRTLPVIFRRKPRKRIRRVTRVVRHIDTWSVFKVALVFNVVLYVVCLTAGVLLWNVAYTTGTIDNVEKFFEQFGWSSFEFKGGEIYHHAWIAGLFAIIGLTGFAVLLATLFNLITDLVGGVRVSVLEEEVVARPAGGETTVIRRRPKRERADRALASLERFERETAAREPTARRTNVGRFTRSAVHDQPDAAPADGGDVVPPTS